MKIEIEFDNKHFFDLNFFLEGLQEVINLNGSSIVLYDIFYEEVKGDLMSVKEEIFNYLESNSKDGLVISLDSFIDFAKFILYTIETNFEIQLLNGEKIFIEVYDQYYYEISCDNDDVIKQIAKSTKLNQFKVILKW